MAGTLYFWFWKVPLDIRVEGLLPRGHVLCLRAVGMDEHAVRLLYEIEPPIERGRLWPDMCLWLLTARDNLGTEYDDASGTIGTAPDGETTDGVRSLSRVAADGATELELSIRATEAPAGGGPPACVVRVQIPPW